MDLLSMLQVLLALVFLWAFGFLIIDLLAPGYFRPRAKEAAVSLIVGVLLPGLIVFPILRAVDGTVWFSRVLVVTMPTLFVLLAIAWILRRKRQRVQSPISQTVDRLRTLSRHQIIPMSSAVVIFFAAILFVAFRPGRHETDALELYASRDQSRVAITINNTGDDPISFLVVVSESDGASTTYQIDNLSKVAGPQTIMTKSDRSLEIDLFRVGQDTTAEQPLRWLKIAGRDGSLQ